MRFFACTIESLSIAWSLDLCWYGIVVLWQGNQKRFGTSWEFDDACDENKAVYEVRLNWVYEMNLYNEG